MQSMNHEVKHDSYVLSNIVAVKTPNNSNDTIDNKNQFSLDENDTQCNANTNSPDVNKTIGLHRSTRLRKSSSYLNYVEPKIMVKRCYNVILMMPSLTVINMIITLLGNKLV